MKTIIYTAMLSLGLMACSGGKTEQSTETQANTEEKAAQKSSASIPAYMALKDALVQTDAMAAKSAASDLTSAFSNENMGDALIEAANAIATSDDVAVQRTQFKIVTDGLIASLKANGIEDGVYVQYCPMAFDNTGANWLSMSDQIRNPYFGDMMLKCGKVEEKL